MHYRRLDDQNSYKARLRTQPRKNYAESKRCYQPIRELKEQVHRLQTIQNAPDDRAGRKQLNIEECYEEFSRKQELPLHRFFMTLLHMTNDGSGRFDIVGSS